MAEDHYGGNELQYAGQVENDFARLLMSGNLSSVWWKVKSDRAIYGGDGDDSYLFSGAR